MSVNSCTFSGRVGRDSEVRYTQNQKAITQFSMAVDVGWGDNKRTLWITCKGWGNRWEKISPYITKGTKITVTGELDQREYERNDGTKGVSLELNLREIDLHGEKRESGRQESTGGFREGSYKGDTQKPAPAATGGSSDGFEDDDIPF